MKCLLEQSFLGTGKEKEDSGKEAEEDVETMSLKTNELASEEVVIKRSEEDAKVVSKEVTENFGGEVSIHMIPGNLSCR